ncbi:hypothetical protein BC936DRAFT_136766 [Jimgerdemannia flammicorona]|uniref:Uncharacterized protein n=1 Tax=Jimgerdemannia flammicorona TaxID=994334 RepID=A0A433DJB0_9FUNG|nr:hypothetical protein BC936DRAFT_136766 [Jimgerdemannia flammicorona]
MSITNLPAFILENIIVYSDRVAWSLVSKQFAALANSPMVKSEWLAGQAILPRETRDTGFQCMCGVTINEPQLAPLYGNLEWRHLFLENCDKGHLKNFRYHPQIPVAQKLVRIPSSEHFLDYAVVHMIYTRHRAVFKQLREFLLCWSAFLLDERMTCFCIEHGAPVNYARGWVLARFACARQMYCREMVRKLVFKYGARLDFHYHNDGSINVLGAILFYRDDEELALEILENTWSIDLLENHGNPLIIQAVDQKNLKMLRFLLEYQRDKSTDVMQLVVAELIAHIRTWGGSGAVMQMLTIEYNAPLEVSPDSFWCAIRAHDGVSEDFSLIQWYLDRGAALNEHQLAYAIGQKSLFRFLCKHARAHSLSSGIDFLWSFVVQVAVAKKNLEAVLVLLDDGYWDVHQDDDLALRSFGRDESALQVPDYNRPAPTRHCTGWKTRESHFYQTTIRLIPGYKDRSVLLLLLERGANVHANREESLRNALRQGDVLTMLMLLEYGADIEVLREPSEFVDGSSLVIPLPHGADIHVSKPWKSFVDMYRQLHAISFIIEVGHRLGFCNEGREVRVIGEDGVLARSQVLITALWAHDAELNLLDDKDPLDYLTNSGYHSFTLESYRARGRVLRRQHNNKIEVYREMGKKTWMRAFKNIPKQL